MWLDYVKQKEEGKGLENFQGGHECMKQEKQENPNATKNQIDFILSSDRKIVRNCEVITKVDIGSDHQWSEQE